MGWEPVKTVGAVTALLILAADRIEEVSLDNDLGEGQQEGYTILDWVEHKMHEDPTYVPPAIKVHSANSVARQRMNIVIQRVGELVAERTGGDA